jgi:hypothetical protein
MSNGFAIAAVTAVLKERLQDRLGDADVQAAIGPVKVTSLPPDRIQSGGAEPNQLNIYLHHAAPNAAFRNAGDPIRDSGGARIARPPLPLDLHYLITAFGIDTYAGEILLGHAMQEMHERPLLDPASIHQVLAPTVPDPNLPAPVSGSGLDDQRECLRITPEAVGSEEMSRLWTALQAQYRTTAAYTVGVVLIDPEEPARKAYPVRDRGIGADAVAVPAVRDVVVAPATGPVDPAAPIVATSRLLIRGEHLDAPGLAVVVGREMLPVTERRPDGPVVDLAAATALRPGTVPVQVLLSETVRSNTVPVAVHATISATVANDVVTVTVAPEVGADQRVVLLLNEKGPPSHDPPRAFSFSPAPGNGVPANADSTATVPVAIDVPADTYVVRLEVDGVDSILDVDAGTGRYAVPSVAVP